MTTLPQMPQVSQTSVLTPMTSSNVIMDGKTMTYASPASLSGAVSGSSVPTPPLHHSNHPSINTGISPTYYEHIKYSN
jgi:hypothetical protein